MPFLLFAQDRTIESRILDASNREPLVGAHVMLQSNWKIGAISDFNGNFVLDLREATVKDSLIVSYLGFVEQVLSITDIKAGQSILLYEVSNALQDIEIIGEYPISEEFSIEKIERLEIYKNPSAKADALLAVNALPSSTTVDETANISFRGSSPAQSGIFFNQVPVYDAVRFSQLNGIGTFSIFNTEIINKVHVFAGNPPLEFGNSTSGLVAIQSEDQLISKRLTSILISLASVGINHRQRTGERSSLALFSNYQFSLPLKTLNAVSLANILKFSSVDAGLHWVFHSPKNMSVKFFNYTLNESYDYNFRSPSYKGIFQQSRFSNLSIINIVKKFKGSSIAINLGNRWSNQHYEYSKARYDIQDRDYYGSIQYRREKKRSGMKAGIAYDGRFQKFKGIIPSYFFAQGPEHPFEVVQPSQKKREILDLFLYYKIIPSDNLTIGLAGRKNIPWNEQQHYFSRQFNINYQVNPFHNLKMAIGTFNQYMMSQDNGDPIRLKTNQISLDHQYQYEGLIFSTALFYKHTNFEKNYSERNVGIEVLTRYKPSSRVSLSLSYTGLKVTREVDGVRYPSQYDLPFFIRLGAEWNFIKMYTLGVRGLFRKGTWYQPVAGTTYHTNLDSFEPIYASPDQSIRNPDYNLLDISVTALYPLGDNMGLVAFVSAGNIFNFQNLRNYNYNWNYTIKSPEYFSRRTFYFGGMINF